MLKDKRKDADKEKIKEPNKNIDKQKEIRLPTKPQKPKKKKV